MSFTLERKKRNLRLVDIAPLVDIVFLLLIFFMVSADFMKPVLQLALPVLKTEDNIQKLDIVIAVDNQQNITLNQMLIAKESLQKELATLIKEKKQNEIIFRGDKNISFGFFTELMDIAKLAGGKSFSIEHIKK